MGDRNIVEMEIFTEIMINLLLYKVTDTNGGDKV
jgi:hypothetical protein